MIPANLAYRRYLRRIGLSAAIYLAAIFAAVRFLPDNAPANAGSVVIALIPGLAVLGMVWAIGRLLVELDDEYLRMLEVRKALAGTGLALAVSSVWGILELFTQVPRLQVFWILPVWCLGLAVGAIWNRLTLGDAGCA